MIGRLRRRRRAVRLGTTQGALSPTYWHDPESGAVWMASSRYAPFTVDVDRDVERVVRMLSDVHVCSLEVSRAYPDPPEEIDA